MRFSFLSAQNFYGLDILPFAVEIAKVTMMIARKLAIDELHITEPALPLDNLDKNFIAADALLTPEGLPAQWPQSRRHHWQPAVPRRETAKARTRAGLCEHLAPRVLPTCRAWPTTASIGFAKRTIICHACTAE